MLRKRVRALFTEKRFRPKLKVLSRLMILIGLLWLISFPYMSRAVFTSENALRARIQATLGKSDSGIYPMFKRIQGDLKKIWNINPPKDRWKEANKFILNELSPKYEIYSQENYIYSYIRANGGYGNEC